LPERAAGTTAELERIERLAELIRSARCTVALTGAGISVPSGIPDFRSPGTGLWEKVDPMEVAHIDVFRRDPARFWSFYGQRFASLTDKQPNDAHLALAELERRGLVQAVITQNIDTLHARAGSRDVVEVHGSIRSAQCLGCLWTEPADAVLAQLADSRAPTCPQCGEVLKPGVVLFGELLPAYAMERATQLARSARLVLVVGSSLEVWPVAGLPLEARAFAIVNRGPTALDDHATLKIDAAAGETLSAVLDAL
jgi:NAD-dependent deacetylase